MDEFAWDGSGGEVTDSSGNGRDGTAQGGATTDNSEPAIPGDPGTCSYGTFDGDSGYVEVGNLSDILNGTASLAFWIRTTQDGNDTGWQAPGVTGVEQSGGTDDIFWGWIDASGNIGISVGNDFAEEQKSMTEINDGNWHHVVLTRDAGSGATKIYVNGQLERNGTTGAGVIGNTYSGIGRVRNTGGADLFLGGDLDEVRVYDSILEDSDVEAIFNSTHACPATSPGECAADFALYSDDDLDIGDRVEVNGTEVFGSGNAVEPDTAERVSATRPLPMFDPVGFPNFSGPDVQVPPANNTITAGDYDEIRINPNRSVVFDTGNGNDFRIQSLEARDRVTLNFQPGRYFIDEFEAGNDVELNIVGGGPVELFIGDELEAGDRVAFNVNGNPGDLIIRFYDGAELEFGNDSALTGTVYAPGDDSALEFGDRNIITGGVFAGGEIEIGNDSSIFYNAAAETVGREVAQCGASGPAYYAIEHSGTGVTCLAEPVTITARNSNDDPIDPGNTTISLSTTALAGDWSNVLAGSGSLNNGTPGDGSATYAFPGGEASVTLAFNFTDIPDGQNVESFFFDVTDGSASDLGDGDPLDPEITFSRTGFRFVNISDGNTQIPAQIAGKPSNVPPLDRVLGIQAIRSADGDPTICEPAFPAGSDREIEMAAECRNPATCAGESLLINGTAIATPGDNAGPGAAAYSPVTLSFGAEALAEFDLRYPDSGSMQLHARYEIPLADDAQSPSGDFMLGSSNNFVVRPFGFDIQIDGNPGGDNANADVFRAAGEDFDATVRAVVWQSGDDGNNDGVPDGHADNNPGNNTDLSGNAVTPNFGNESSGVMVLLSALLDQPSGGNAGALMGGTGLTDFTNGVAATTLSYSEVGIIEIVGELDDYLGSGQDVHGASGYVGRFIPYDFDVVRNTPEFASACTGGADDFTYIGQRFEYATAPVLTVTARAKGGSTTQNYRDDFFKLTDAKLNSDGNKTYMVETGTLDTNLVTVPDPAIVDSGNGSATLTFNSGTGFRFTREDPEPPFDAEISLSINVIDEDDVVYGDGDGNNLNPARFGEASENEGIAFTDSKEQRWGRLRLTNAGGSELMPLEMPVEAEFYNPNGVFVLNTDDNNCAGVALADFDFSGPLEGVSTPPGYTPINNGTGALTFPAPGAGNTGYVDVEALLDAAMPMLGYLQYDWQGDNDYDDNPRARATFGIYRGAADLIYIREPW